MGVLVLATTGLGGLAVAAAIGWGTKKLCNAKVESTTKKIETLTNSIPQSETDTKENKEQFKSKEVNQETKLQVEKTQKTLKAQQPNRQTFATPNMKKISNSFSAGIGNN